MDQVNIKPLTNQEEINQALKLLYRVYCVEMQWQPPANNPSCYQILYLNDEPILTDKYEQVAQWYGIFDSDQQIGCFRLLPPINNLYELEEYSNINNLPKPGVEIGRLAIESKSRILKQIALYRYFEFILNKIPQEQLSLVVTTHLPALQKIFEQLEFASQGTLFYHHTEEKPAQIYSLSTRTDSIDQKLQAYHDRVKKLSKAR
jgi:hypothetical protein